MESKSKGHSCGAPPWLLIALVGLLPVGGLVAGWSLSNLQTERVESQLVTGAQGEVQRLQDINRQLLIIIEKRLPAIAETAGTAAETAKAAADAARTAGREAGTAAVRAKQAAAQVKQAAQAVDQAVTPAPVAPAEAPGWLN